MKQEPTCVVESEFDRPRPRAFSAVGLTIVAVLPAIFWAAVVSQIAWAAGFNLSMAALALVACAIGGFLAIVYAALVVGTKAQPTSPSDQGASATPAAAQPSAFPPATANPAGRGDKPADSAAV